MDAHGGDLTGLAVVVLAALICGIAMARLRQPAIVGYILAGLVLGPSGLKLVQDRAQIETLADLGVLVLLFLIGMELSIRSFQRVWKVAVPTALLQVAASLALIAPVAWYLEWDTSRTALFSFVVALSSTAVVVKMVEQLELTRGELGQLIIGILIAQDLAVVPMILALNAMAGPGVALLDIAKIAGSVGILALLLVWLGRRGEIELPFTKLVARQFDLRPLAGLTYCFGFAALTGVVGLSEPFGAFLAGLIIGNSTSRASMARTMRPIQSALMMVFFLSVGLLIDLGYVWDNIGTVAVLLLIITVAKTILNIGILHVLREPWPHAFVAGVMLAQIGEFSFVLGRVGQDAGIITAEDGALVVAIAALSLLFSPLWQLAARRLMRVILLSVTSLNETLDMLGGRWLDDVQRVIRHVTRMGRGPRTRARRRAVVALGRQMKRERARRQAKAAEKRLRATLEPKEEQASGGKRQRRKTRTGETPAEGQPGDA